MTKPNRILTPEEVEALCMIPDDGYTNEDVGLLIRTLREARKRIEDLEFIREHQQRSMKKLLDQRDILTSLLREMTSSVTGGDFLAGCKARGWYNDWKGRALKMLEETKQRQADAYLDSLNTKIAELEAERDRLKEQLATNLGGARRSLR